jgi:simple sugar transport system permease protein
VLRQVSTTGLIATGMTAVTITGGIDLSVGSLMAIGSVVCAMLLTVEGVTPAVAMWLPAAALVALVAGFAGTGFGRRNIAGPARRGRTAEVAVGLVLAGLLLAWLWPQVGSHFGVAAVLIVTPSIGLMFGAINGFVITAGPPPAVHCHAGDDGDGARRRAAD